MHPASLFLTAARILTLHQPEGLRYKLQHGQIVVRARRKANSRLVIPVPPSLSVKNVIYERYGGPDVPTLRHDPTVRMCVLRGV